MQLHLPPGTTPTPREEALAAAEKEIRAAHERTLSAAASTAGLTAVQAPSEGNCSLDSTAVLLALGGSGDAADVSISSLRTRSRGSRPPLPPAHARTYSGSACEISLPTTSAPASVPASVAAGDEPPSASPSPASPADNSPENDAAASGVSSAQPSTAAAAAQWQPLSLHPSLGLHAVDHHLHHHHHYHDGASAGTGRHSGRDRLDSDSPAPSVRSRRRRASSADTSSALPLVLPSALQAGGPSLSLAAELRYADLHDDNDGLDSFEGAAAQLAAASSGGSKSPSRAHSPSHSPRLGVSASTGSAHAPVAVSRTSSRAPSRLRSVRPASSRAQSPLVRSVPSAGAGELQPVPTGSPPPAPPTAAAAAVRDGAAPRSAAKDLMQRSGALADLAMEGSAPSKEATPASSGSGGADRPALTIPLPDPPAAAARTAAPPSPMPAPPASLLARYAANSEADRRRAGAGAAASGAAAAASTARRAGSPEHAAEGGPDAASLSVSSSSRASMPSAAAITMPKAVVHPLAVAKARQSHASGQSLASLAAASESETDSCSDCSDSSDEDYSSRRGSLAGRTGRAASKSSFAGITASESADEGFDEFVVLGSDGLFDAFPNRQELMNRIKAALREAGDVDAACDRIVACAAVERHVNDDVSMCLIVFNQLGISTATAGALGGSIGYAKRAGARRIESRPTRFLQRAADLRGRMQRSRSFDASAGGAVLAAVGAAVATVPLRSEAPQAPAAAAPSASALSDAVASKQQAGASLAIAAASSTVAGLPAAAAVPLEAGPSSPATDTSQSVSATASADTRQQPPVAHGTSSLSTTGTTSGLSAAFAPTVTSRVSVASAAASAAVALPALVAPPTEDGRRALASASVVTAMFPAAGHRTAPFVGAGAAVSVAASASAGGGPMLPRDRPLVHARAATTIAAYWSADPRAEAALAAAAGSAGLHSRTARRAAWTTDAIPTHRTASSFSASLGLPKLEPLLLPLKHTNTGMRGGSKL